VQNGFKSAGFKHRFAMKKPEGDCEFWSFVGYTKKSLRKEGDYLDQALFAGIRGLLKD